jgi:hypothetical protein
VRDWLTTSSLRFNELDGRLERLRAPAGPLSSNAGARAMQAHEALCRCRQVLSAQRHTFTDAPATERVRVAAAARRSARIGVIALLATLTDFGVHELRLHLKRTRERLGGAAELSRQLEFACLLRDLALCLARSDEATALGGAAMSRLLDSSALGASGIGWQLRDVGARLHDEQRDAAFVTRELHHFRELEAAVIDANARAQVLGLAVRALKAKLRALTRQQYHHEAGADASDDVDVNVLEVSCTCCSDCCCYCCLKMHVLVGTFGIDRAIGCSCGRCARQCAVGVARTGFQRSRRFVVKMIYRSTLTHVVLC